MSSNLGFEEKENPLNHCFTIIRRFFEVPSARLSRYALILIETGQITLYRQLIRFQHLINYIKFCHYPNIPINYQKVAPILIIKYYNTNLAEAIVLCDIYAFCVSKQHILPCSGMNMAEKMVLRLSHHNEV